MVEAVEGVGTKESMSSDRVAPWRNGERVEGGSDLSQCIELLQAIHVSAFKCQRLQWLQLHHIKYQRKTKCVSARLYVASSPALSQLFNVAC